MAKRRPGQKKRVEFRPNRQQRRRTDEWTRLYKGEAQRLDEAASSESVRAKGEMSRKRTVIVDEAERPAVDRALWRRGLVVEVFGLVCRVEDEAGRAWDCSIRRVLRTLLIESRAPVSVGDEVWFSDHSASCDGEPVGVIEQVEPRRAVLSRRDFRGRQHTIVANVDQLLIVASVAQPSPKPHLIDRYLVAAVKGDLRPVICFNKCDLAGIAPPEAAERNAEPPADAPASTAAARGMEAEDEDGNENGRRGEVENESHRRRADENENEKEKDSKTEHEDEYEYDEEAGADEGEEGGAIHDVEFEDEDFQGRRLSLDELIHEYKSLGYCCLLLSAETGAGLEDLRRELGGKVTVLSGQSGVGKTSLINAIEPGLGLTVSEVSRDTEKGRHTTTHARLLRLSQGGHVVDTPGIRQFELWNVTPGELEACFIEFVPLVPHCRFNDCHHRNEQGCAVIAAMEAGIVSQRRYFSYLKMLEESGEEQQRKYD